MMLSGFEDWWAMGTLRLCSGSADGAVLRQPLAENPICLFPWLSLLAALANFAHAFGVFWNHACTCVIGGHFDVGGMDAAVLFNTFVAALVLSFLGNAGPGVQTTRGCRRLYVATGVYVILVVLVYALQSSAFTNALFALGIGFAVIVSAWHAYLYGRSASFEEHADRPRPLFLVACVVCLGKLSQTS